MSDNMRINLMSVFSMITTVAAAVKNAPWQGSDGIITEGVSTSSNNDGVGFKGMESISGENYVFICSTYSHFHSRFGRGFCPKSFK